MATISPVQRRAAISGVFLTSLVVLGWNAGSPGLAAMYVDPVAKIQSQDESLYGSISLEMAKTGDWLTPRFLDRYALFKPPVLYWLQASAIKALGRRRTIALRLPSILAGAATVTLVFVWLLGDAVLAENAPLAAAAAGALLLLSSHLFFVLSRIGLTDALLTFETALAMFALARDPRLASRASLWTFGLASGAAILTKGIAGLFALLALGVFCAVSYVTSRERFLRRCGVSEGFLSGWSNEESKRDLLHRLFPKLENSGDPGLRLVNRMADSLIQQTSFPDLIGWEDATEKIANATAAVTALRDYRNAQRVEAATEKEKADARKRAAEINAEIQARAADLTKLEDQLTELSKELGTSGAGYAFQDWFYNLADYFEVLHRRPYVVDGRQIDGSITVDGTTYLVELKFTREQSDAPDIDSLFKKVGGKADNTMGIMFSISGYSRTAVKEASGPRGLLLLFDHNHLFMLLHRTCTFEELITRVRRHASQTGEAYLSPRSFNE